MCTQFCDFYLYEKLIPSDDLSLAGHKAWYQEKWIFMKFQNLVRSWCAIRRLIVVWSSRLKQWMTPGVSILAGLCCLIVENDLLSRFVHKMVGSRSSARLPVQIKPGKLWKVFFIPGFCATYVDL